MVSKDMYQAKDNCGSIKSQDLASERVSDANRDKTFSASWLAANSSVETWVRAANLVDLFCSWDLAYRCVSGGWLKPIMRGKRRTIYRLADVLSCMKRIEAGEVPPSRPKKQKS
jgi:hypothetical protein